MDEEDPDGRTDPPPTPEQRPGAKKSGIDINKVRMHHIRERRLPLEPELEDGDG